MTPQNETPRQTTSSSEEEVAAKRPEEVRPRKVKGKPLEAPLQGRRATPPQSSLRDDSSSIEEERGAKSWLRRRARQLRTRMTPHEKAMWRLLREGELVALNWRKQADFGTFILDFVSHPARLVIEVDGSQHARKENVDYDAERTAWLSSQGYRVLRFWNNEAIRERDGVWRTIQAAASESPALARMKRWRAQHITEIKQANANLLLDGGGGRAAAGGGARSTLKEEPPEAHSSTPLASPPQSSLRDDSSSIEEEQS